jgi:hypothetical protein
VKRYFGRTNKNRYAHQISKHERRERLLRGIKRKEQKGKEKASGEKSTTGTKNPSLAFVDHNPLPFTSPKDHHHISESKRHHSHVPNWLGENSGDPAIEVRD